MAFSGGWARGAREGRNMEHDGTCKICCYLLSLVAVLLLDISNSFGCQAPWSVEVAVGIIALSGPSMTFPSGSEGVKHQDCRGCADPFLNTRTSCPEINKQKYHRKQQIEPRPIVELVKRNKPKALAKLKYYHPKRHETSPPKESPGQDWLWQAGWGFAASDQVEAPSQIGRLCTVTAFCLCLRRRKQTKTPEQISKSVLFSSRWLVGWIWKGVGTKQTRCRRLGFWTWFQHKLYFWIFLSLRGGGRAGQQIEKYTSSYIWFRNIQALIWKGGRHQHRSFYGSWMRQERKELVSFCNSSDLEPEPLKIYA